LTEGKGEAVQSPPSKAHKDPHMKRLKNRIMLFVIFLVVFIPAIPFSQDHIEKDPIYENRYNIFRDGERNGYLQKDRIFEDRTNQYDKDGTKSGYWEEDSIYEGRYNKYEDGRRDGYLERDSLFDERINQYDSEGRLKGYWQKDSLSGDRYNFKPKGVE
jgi:hypothetical protein